MFNQKIPLIVLLSVVLYLITSCAPEVRLTTSWTNREAKIKSSPQIMVMVLGKANSKIREDAENNLVARLKKEGFKAVPASGLFQPGVSKYDSAELVSILRKNNIDMLLASAVVAITEKERFIPGAIQGTTVQVPEGRYPTPYSPYYNNYIVFGNYYNYYDSYRLIDPPPTPGVTVTDVEVLIESNLYEVETPALIWYGQSMLYTKQPSKKIINAFSKLAVSDIMKYSILVK